MNLSMQIRRAFVTLGLAATAMVFVAARTSMGASVHVQNPLSESAHAETAAVRETFMLPRAAISVHIVAPILATKGHTTRKIARLHCERAANG